MAVRRRGRLEAVRNRLRGGVLLEGGADVDREYDRGRVARWREREPEPDRAPILMPVLHGRGRPTSLRALAAPVISRNQLLGRKDGPVVP